MNLAYKTSAIFLLLLTSIFAREALAGECALVDIVNDDNAEKYLKLVEIDNQIITEEDQTNNLEGKYSIAKGNRAFTLIEAPKKLRALESRIRKAYALNSFQTVNRKAQKMYLELSKQQRVHQLAINVADNTSYTIGFNQDNNKTIEVLSTKEYQCRDDNEMLQLVDINNELESVENLPQDLRNFLDNLIISYNTLSATEQANSRFKPTSIYSIFGAIVDSEFTHDKAIRVLTVLPNSAAFKIGLRSNDKITGLAVGEVSNLSPAKIMNQYIQDNNAADKLTFSIERAGIKQVLVGENMPMILPSSWFTINDETVANSQLDDISVTSKLNKEYYITLLMLSNHYMSNNIANGRVTLVNDKPRKKTLGIVGNELKNKGLFIKEVKSQSLFEQAGLLQGDIITSIADTEEVIDDVNVLKRYMKSLNDKDPFTLLVRRGDVEITLKGVMKEEVIPRYRLTIDFDSINELKARLTNLAHENSRNRNSPIWKFSPSIFNGPYFYSPRPSIYENRAEERADRGAYSRSASGSNSGKN